MEGIHASDPGKHIRVTVGGEYLEIEKPKKLVYTWLWEGSPPETHTTTVTILLKKVGENKTEVTLIHTGFADENMKKDHNQGWEPTFRRLEKFLS